VLVVVVAPDDRRLAILVDTSVRVITGMWSIARMILCLSMERQWGIRAAGVDTMHDLRMMRLLSACHSKERSSGGWVPFIGSDISTEWPKGLDKRVSSSGFGEDVASTAGI